MSEFAAEAAALQEAAEETPLPTESRQSLDILLDRPSPNGSHTADGPQQRADDQDAPEPAGDQDEDEPLEEGDNNGRIAQLQAELERVTSERDGFQSQYRGLLGKLSNMRTTLGDKLRQDAVSMIDVFPISHSEQRGLRHRLTVSGGIGQERTADR